MKDSDIDWQKNAILTPFLTYVVILYSVPYVFASLTGGSQPGAVRGRLLSLWTLAGLSPNPTPFGERLTNDRSLCGYLCIYNFITPTHSFQLFSQYSTHVTCFCCFLVYTAGTFWLEIPNWLLCQILVCNISVASTG